MNLDSENELHHQTVDENDLNAQLKNAVIMMVDDEPILMDVLQTFLEEEGYHRFVTVEDSTSAMGVIHKTMPDVLLLDLKMPGVSGFDILLDIRKDANLKRLPVIVLTSSSDAATKLKALELGATDFLAKPVDASELALRLRNTLTVKAYLDQLAYYDALTGLPNRVKFLERLDWAMVSAERSNERIAILKLTIDRFKQINDTLGPDAGDVLLQQVSKRLLKSVRTGDVVSHTGRENLWLNIARLGGDEFSILLPGGSAAEDAAFVANRLLMNLREPFMVEDHEVFITGSIGITVYPDDAQSVNLLMKNVSAAAEYAKQNGRDSYQFFSEEINRKATERLRLESELRRAIENEEFVLHYQPKIGLSNNQVIGTEALIRWQHPEKGLVSPFQFIQVAEEAGLIADIGQWVIKEACRQNKLWMEQGVGAFYVSVNVSPDQFSEVNLQKTLDAAIATQMDMNYLVIEITESMLMGDEERVIGVLESIRKAGPKLSIDDFGTGYSSLSYLKRFPVDELKIDRSFLLEVPENRDDCAIVKAIIAMAHSLELSVVAEGVEEKKQLDFLEKMGCDVIQGYYFSKPLSPEDFERFVRER